MSHHLAQLNVGTILYDLADPRMKGFVDNLEQINALADASPGFVWRLQDESGDATGFQVSKDPRLIVNLSLWETTEALFDFVYRSAHTGIMAQRRRWFVRPAEAYQVLWWVPAGQVPTVEAALVRLERLRELGPTREAFTFKQRFPAPGTEQDDSDLRPEPDCVGWS